MHSFQMRSAVELSAMAMALTCAAGHAAAQKILVDLGTNSTFRGASVVSPDANGNVWNSLDSFQFNTNLLDTSGAGTGVSLGFSSLGGTDSFNGPLTNPDGTGNPALPGLGPGLGDLAVGEAAFDYFVNASFDIFNLDPSTQYELTFYGSHKFSTDSTTRYSIFSDNSPSATLLGTVDLDHQDPSQPFLANTNEVASIILTPGGGGTFTISFEGLNGNSGYLNAFSLEVIPSPGAASLLGIAAIGVARRRR
ncbi:MAG: hypothetical protein ACTS22_03885 [Phycisphaerales bacterium]